MLLSKYKIWLKNLLLLFLTCIFIIIICELLLSLFIWRIDNQIEPNSPKARIYGWAPYPKAKMKMRPPDSPRNFYFKTNSQGWKDVEHSRGKRPGVFRILIIGDSHTYGFVPLEETYHRRLEKILRARIGREIEVIGVGVCGWGTDQELEFLQREGLDYQPDLVICQFSENDLVDITIPDESKPTSADRQEKRFKYTIKDGALHKIKFSQLEGGIIDDIKTWVKRSALYYEINLLKFHLKQRTSKGDRSDRENFLSKIRLFYQFLNPQSPKSTEAAQNYTMIMNSWMVWEKLAVEMQNLCDKQGIKFMIFSESADSSLRKWHVDNGWIFSVENKDFITIGGDTVEVDLDLINNRLNEICRRNNIEVIPAVREYDRFTSDRHHSSLGNLHMAEDIADYLLSRPWWETDLEKIEVINSKSGTKTK